MYKFALVLGAAITVVAVASAVTAKRSLPTDLPKGSMPSIEQMTSNVKDLPEQSFPAY
jgi:hypothetical protein